MGTRTTSFQVKSSFEMQAWKWMRFSGALLLPLAGLHVVIKDVLVGVHKIDLNYVQQIWSFTAWRIYDFLLLVFALTHGMMGLRQVLLDFVHTPSKQRLMSRVLFLVWLIVLLMGAMAIIGGVRIPDA